jgi:CelD/BcsL family acetyltransferase involved in cellulose biosynthesis
MLRAETFHPSDLPPVLVEAWREMCERHPDFRNPLLGPDFARAVGEVRGDARVTVWHYATLNGGSRPAGFLAYHRRAGGVARPIGAPLSDYTALVSSDVLDIDEALTVAGLSAYRFNGLIDPFGSFRTVETQEQESYLIELDGSAEDYLEALRASSPKRFKNYRRLDHKLDREVGDLRIVAHDADPAVLGQLLDWKRDQLARTGGQDFLRPVWIRQLLAGLHQQTEGPLQGLLISLYAGSDLVAGHFGIRSGSAFHPWIAATDPRFAAWSPGQIFLLRAIAAMPELGLTSYDIGPGHDHYKRPYARSTRLIRSGAATAATPLGRAAQATEQVWTLAGARRDGAVGRLRRRLDAITAVEPSLGGQAVSLMATLASRARRTSNESAG